MWLSLVVLVFAGCCAAVIIERMPRSARALALRRQRAMDRGFLQQLPPGRRYVEVAAAVAEEVKAMAKSKELHVSHELAVGRAFHYARHATLAARSLIGENDWKRSNAAHRAANRAKHGSRHRWADVHDDGAASSGIDSEFREDPLQAKDPWLGACGSLPAPCVPSQGDAWASWTPASKLNVDASPFSPMLGSKGCGADLCSSCPHREHHMALLQNLVAAQNDTIAVLAARLGGLVASPAASSGDSPSADQKDIKYGTVSAVQGLAGDMRALVLGVSEALEVKIEEAKKSTGGIEKFTSHLEKLLTNYDNIVDKKISSLRAELRTLFADVVVAPSVGSLPIPMEPMHSQGGAGECMSEPDGLACSQHLSPLGHITTYPYVRLHGLTAATTNGRCGHVYIYIY